MSLIWITTSETLFYTVRCCGEKEWIFRKCRRKTIKHWIIRHGGWCVCIRFTLDAHYKNKRAILFILQLYDFSLRDTLLPCFNSILPGPPHIYLASPRRCTTPRLETSIAKLAESAKALIHNVPLYYDVNTSVTGTFHWLSYAFGTVL